MKNKHDDVIVSLASLISDRLGAISSLDEEVLSGALIEMYPAFIELLRYYYYRNHSLAYHCFIRGRNDNTWLFRDVNAGRFGMGGCRIIAIHDKLLRFLRSLDGIDFQFLGGYFQRHHTHTSLFLHKHFQGKACDLSAPDNALLANQIHDRLSKNGKQGYRVYYSDNFVHLHITNGHPGCFCMNYAALPPCCNYYRPSVFTHTLVPNII